MFSLLCVIALLMPTALGFIRCILTEIISTTALSLPAYFWVCSLSCILSQSGDIAAGGPALVFPIFWRALRGEWSLNLSMVFFRVWKVAQLEWRRKRRATTTLKISMSQTSWTHLCHTNIKKCLHWNHFDLHLPTIDKRRINKRLQHCVSLFLKHEG